MKSRGLFLFACSLFILPHAAMAEDAVSCDTACDSGYRLISYADGNSVTCACVAEGQMEPTVPDPNVVEGPITEDSE